MSFRSAVDGWLRALVLLNTVVVSCATVPLLIGGAHDQTPGQVLLALATLLIGVGLPLWVFLGTAYRVDGQTLNVRSGPFRWSVPLRDIQSVRDSRSTLSGPALSLQRLEIVYGAGRRLLVSPADRTAFLSAIGHRLGTV